VPLWFFDSVSRHGACFSADGSAKSTASQIQFSFQKVVVGVDAFFVS
jgi:hypothetical protein